MRPYLLSYAGVEPVFAGPPAHAGPGAAVLGRATLGARASLGASSVIRADGHVVTAGDEFRLGPRATVHIAHELYPTHIGDRVAVGRNAVVHACTVGNDCVIGDDAVVLDGSVLEDGVILEPGAVVFPRSRLTGGQVYAGAPAKPVRAAEPGEVAARSRAMADAMEDGARPLAEPGDASIPFFVAATARLRGRVEAGSNASIWFGCDLDAGAHAIVLGERANVQDNTVMRCTSGPITFGAGSVVGHNVELATCAVGAGSLVGIGARVAEGTVIEDDVLLAAGATTTPGQVLHAGWLWAGRPARPLSRMDEAKRAMISGTNGHYVGYARDFDAAQRALARRG